MSINNLLFLLIFAQILSAYEMPTKLILHMDVNKTIIAEDLANGKSIDDILIESLAKYYKGTWDPSLKQKITYVQYVKDYLFPGEKSNKKIRKLRNEAIHSFLDVLKEIKDPRYPMILKRFNKLLEKIQMQKGKIFASFYKLISYLEKEKIPYAIILRTFGTDLAIIAHELASTINLTFDWNGHFRTQKLYLKSTHTQEEIILETAEDIFTFFKERNHVRIKDDFKTWNDNREQAEYGKLFPIPRNRKIKTIFFDDNAEENIINARDSISGSFLDPNKLINEGIICSVDTLQVIEDDDYFIKQLLDILNK